MMRSVVNTFFSALRHLSATLFQIGFVLPIHKYKFVGRALAKLNNF
jgi:hypothetical protein